MHIGLLEDDIAIQEMLLLVLQDEGYTVVNFPNAQACLTTLYQQAQDPSSPSIDLLIVDWRLNDTLTGTEVIQQLRAHPSLTSLPIILTTAATFHNTELLRSSRVTLLEKPFSVDDITLLIKQLVKSPPSNT